MLESSSVGLRRGLALALLLGVAACSDSRGCNLGLSPLNSVSNECSKDTDCPGVEICTEFLFSTGCADAHVCAKQSDCDPCQVCKLRQTVGVKATLMTCVGADQFCNSPTTSGKGGA